MKIKLQAIAIILLWALLLPSVNICAESLIKPSKREGRWEIILAANWFDSEDIDFKGGSEINLRGDLGWGFGFNYNLNEHIALGTEFSWNSSKYNLDTFDDENKPVNISGRMYADKIYFNGTYNFFDSTLTPFVTGGFGWTFIDSNIPSGPTDIRCWWDPWYGWICRDYTPTHTETTFTYGAGAGLRWDVTKQFFLKGSVNNLWIDLEKSKGTPYFFLSKFEMGFLF